MGEIKRDWIVYANDLRMMIIFNVPEKEMQESIKHYNRLGKLQKTVYSYKEVSVIITELN